MIPIDTHIYMYTSRGANEPTSNASSSAGYLHIPMYRYIPIHMYRGANEPISNGSSSAGHSHIPICSIFYRYIPIYIYRGASEQTSNCNSSAGHTARGLKTLYIYRYISVYIGIAPVIPQAAPVIQQEGLKLPI